MMAIKACKPGKTLIDIHNVAVKYITKGLIDAKILRGALDKNIKKPTKNILCIIQVIGLV